jgi:hypothetical protein
MLTIFRLAFVLFILTNPTFATHAATAPHKPVARVVSAPWVVARSMPKMDLYMDFEADRQYFAGIPLTGDHKHNQPVHVTRSGTTRNWLVLVNTHKELPLGSSNIFTTKDRIISWGCPLEFAQANLNRGRNVQEDLKLFDESGPGKFVIGASFLLIPPNKSFEFTTGYSRAERANVHGMLMRLKTVPEGSILLISTLSPAAGNKAEVQAAGFSLEKMLKAAIAENNKTNPSLKIPEAAASSGLASAEFSQQSSGGNLYITDLERFLNYHF